MEPTRNSILASKEVLKKGNEHDRESVFENDEEGHKNEDSLISKEIISKKSQKRDRPTHVQLLISKDIFAKKSTKINIKRPAFLQVQSDYKLSHLHRVSSIFKSKQRGELNMFKGIKAKTGPWSVEEVHQLEKNMKDFLKSHNMSSSKSLVFPANQEELDFRRKTSFNLRMCHGIQRFGQSVMRKVVIHFVENLKEGYPIGNEAKMFWKLIKIHGKNWKLIGNVLRRSPQSLYHFYTHEKDIRNKNFSKKSWFNEETEKLVSLVNDFLKNGDKISWRSVSDQIETRSPMQCRQKWWWISNKRLKSICNVEQKNKFL